MYIFDRYLLRLFIKVWLVWFASLTGLYFVVEMFTNLDEFIQISKSFGGWGGVMSEYFAPRILSFFDRTCGLFVLLAAICALGWLRMSNELTAVMAGGVTNWRIVKPLVIAATLVAISGAANRELLLPTLKEKLSRNAQDLTGARARPVQPCYDHATDIFLNGKSAFAIGERIELPSFRLPRTLEGLGNQIVGKQAYCQPANADHPAGFLVEEVSQPANIATVPSLKTEKETVVYCPSETPWLKPDQCFVASNVDFDQLSGGAGWRQYASLPQLIRGLKNPSLAYGDDVRIEVHKRFVQPFLDITLFMLGLPLVLSRKARGVVVSTGLCFLLVTAFFLVTITCHALGQRGLVLTPALAAWTPLIIFVPIARFTTYSLWE